MLTIDQFLTIVPSPYRPIGEQSEVGESFSGPEELDTHRQRRVVSAQATYPCGGQQLVVVDRDKGAAAAKI